MTYYALIVLFLVNGNYINVEGWEPRLAPDLATCNSWAENISTHVLALDPSAVFKVSCEEVK